MKKTMKTKNKIKLLISILVLTIVTNLVAVSYKDREVGFLICFTAITIIQVALVFGIVKEDMEDRI